MVKGITIEDVVGDPVIMAALLNGNAAPPKQTSRRWTGSYTAETDGDYIVALEGSGEGSGNRVTLDGQQIIDNWDLVRAFQPAMTVHLTAGAHKLAIEDKTGGFFGGHLAFAITPAATIVFENEKQIA